jgi:hypothetical protein
MGFRVGAVRRLMEMAQAPRFHINLLSESIIGPRPEHAPNRAK